MSDNCLNNKINLSDEEILKSASLKVTKKRLLLLTLLKTENRPVTAEYLYDKIPDVMNLSTVYRALNSMADKGILIKTIRMDGKIYYLFNDHIHRHELTCSICHKSVDVEDCPFESISKELSEKTGYTITGHNVEFTGVCPECIAHNNK